jgi:hypothetical protein
MSEDSKSIHLSDKDDSVVGYKQKIKNYETILQHTRILMLVFLVSGGFVVFSELGLNATQLLDTFFSFLKSDKWQSALGIISGLLGALVGFFAAKTFRLSQNKKNK